MSTQCYQIHDTKAMNMNVQSTKYNTDSVSHVNQLGCMHYNTQTKRRGNGQRLIHQIMSVKYHIETNNGSMPLTASLHAS